MGKEGVIARLFANRRESIFAVVTRKIYQWSSAGTRDLQTSIEMLIKTALSSHKCLPWDPISLTWFDKISERLSMLVALRCLLNREMGKARRFWKKKPGKI
jgi:hypothetical protein